MTRAIEVHAAVCKARLVVNHGCRHLDNSRTVIIFQHGKRLSQRLTAVKNTGSGLTAHNNALGINTYSIALVVVDAFGFRVNNQTDSAFCLALCCLYGRFYVCHFINPLT